MRTRLAAALSVPSLMRDAGQATTCVVAALPHSVSGHAKNCEPQAEPGESVEKNSDCAEGALLQELGSSLSHYRRIGRLLVHDAELVFGSNSQDRRNHVLGEAPVCEQSATDLR